LPPEIIQHILSYSDTPLQLAFILATQVNGVAEYLIYSPYLYRFMTSALIHLNKSRFLRYYHHKHLFSPFEFLHPPKNSVPGIYFKMYSLWKGDLCFPLYFKEIIQPIIEYITKLLQGSIWPDFPKFVLETFPSSFISKKLNHQSWNDLKMFDCDCYACSNMILL